MLKVHEITRTFADAHKKLTVLDNLSCSVEKGDMVALMGASGSGKTTLLQIIGGLDQPTSGEIHIDDVDITNLIGDEQASFRNSDIGFVFQFHHLLPDFTAVENAMFPGIIAGVDRKECLERATALLSDVGLSDRLDHHPAELSGGERQRVALARALFNRPSLILADEPTGNLDKENTAHFLELIKEHNKKHNQTFIIATHDEEVARALDYRLELSQGTVTKKEV